MYYPFNEQRGAYKVLMRNRFIFIKNDLHPVMENIVLLHELGHDALHREEATKTAEKIRPEGLSKTREVHPGDLILSNSMSFGKPYIMGIDGCIHDGWLLIRNTYGVFDLTFLCHLLGTPQMLSQYRSLAAGSTVNNLNKELVGNTVVTIPSITEQRVLGDYLEQLDNLITLHQRKGKAAVSGCFLNCSSIEKVRRKAEL